MPTLRVLSIDGGGIRGVVPALVLARLEALTGQPVASLFDLIAGTSTGGILALALACPQPLAAGTLAGIYVERGPAVFASTLGRRLGTLGGLFGPAYAATGLEQLLEDFLGETPLADACTRVLVPAYDIERHRPALFKSWRPEAQAILMRDVARATSAAPTYFPPASLGKHTTSRTSALLIDGGIFANNPALCALAEASRLAPGAEVLLLSLGTGESAPPCATARDAGGWGKVGWVRPLLEYMFDGMTDAVDYQARQFLGANYLRLQPVLKNPDQAMDSTTPQHLRALELLAESLLDRETDRLSRFAQRLVSPDETPQSPGSASRLSDSETAFRPGG
jgi:patatin-like phospholipase/acyl hydrolase